MAWAEAKAQIAAVLGGVSISSPVTLEIAHVYSDPPGTIQDIPCFLIIPPALEVSRSAGGLRKKTYTVRLQLLLQDTDQDVAAGLVDAFREATVDAFDDALALNNTVDEVLGPRCEEVSGFTYGGRTYSGLNFFLTVVLVETRTFGA